MKTLSRLRYLIFPLLMATAACGDEDAKKTDPSPAQHQVEVRYSGAGLTGLGARISGGSTNPEGTNPQQVFSISPATATVSATQAIGAVSAAREFNTTISFESVRGSSRAPSGSFLTASIVVDGVVKETLRIDNTTAPGTVYVTTRASIVRSEW